MGCSSARDFGHRSHENTLNKSMFDVVRSQDALRTAQGRMSHLGRTFVIEPILDVESRLDQWPTEISLDTR